MKKVAEKIDMIFDEWYLPDDFKSDVMGMVSHIDMRVVSIVEVPVTSKVRVQIIRGTFMINRTTVLQNRRGV